MKNVFVILLSFSLLFGCKNTNQNSQSDASVAQDSIVTLSADEFLANPASFVDQKVIVKGMVSHVCKHGGQKLFLVSTKVDKYLRINTGKSIAEFPVELEGSNIEVKGLVTAFEQDLPEPDSTTLAEGNESDTSSLEMAYHKDNFYVIVADSYTVND